MKKLIFSWAGTAKSLRAIFALQEQIKKEEDNQYILQYQKRAMNTLLKGMGLPTSYDSLSAEDQDHLEIMNTDDYMDYCEDKASRWGERE